MTDLQTSLIVIGVMIVGGVVCYNKWHEFRARKHVEKAFSTEQDDVLMKNAASGFAGTSVAGASAAERHEPVFFEDRDHPTDVGDFFNDAGFQAPLIASASTQVDILPVDAQIDCVIPLSLEMPVRGEKLLPLLQSLRHVGSKPVHYMGLIQPNAQSPSPNGDRSHMVASIQICRRASNWPIAVGH